jgi:hypothetical protein
VAKFERFNKRLVPLGKAPYITVQKKGIIAFNRAAHALLGSPTTIELLYDPDEKIIGFRVADPEEEYAYAIRTSGPTQDSTYLVSGRAFTRHYGIKTETARRYKAFIDPDSPDILCIDLKHEGTVVSAGRTSRDQEEVPGPGD